MTMFQLLFPAEAARLARAERLLARVAELTGYVESADPRLTGVMAELRAGREIKATELYSKATGCGVHEAALAVQALRATDKA